MTDHERIQESIEQHAGEDAARTFESRVSGAVTDWDIIKSIRDTGHDDYVKKTRKIIDDVGDEVLTFNSFVDRSDADFPDQ